MKQDIFIGVDGGGTKTKVMVEDATGQLIGSARSGPGNIRESAARAWTSINDAIEQALVKAGIHLDDPHYAFHVGLGLAGTEVPAACEAFLRVRHEYTTICLDTDAYVACLGVHGGQDGSIIIIGTGVVGFRTEGDTRRKVGGWGFPHADEGGGAWLGMELTRLAFKSIDGRIPKTALLKDVLAHFKQDSDAFVTWAARAKPGDFGSLAPYIIEHLKEDDPHSVDLMHRAAQEIQLVADALAQDKMEANLPLPSLGLLGGIAPFVEPYLSSDLHQRLVSRQCDPAKGAIIMIQNHLNHLRSQ